MSRSLFWLSDAEWRRIEPWLPRGRRGARRVDDRRVISGIIHVLKTGCRRRELPSVRLGPDPAGPTVDGTGSFGGTNLQYMSTMAAKAVLRVPGEVRS